jgi:hypothetical protein
MLQLEWQVKGEVDIGCGCLILLRWLSHMWCRNGCQCQPKAERGDNLGFEPALGWDVFLVTEPEFTSNQNRRGQHSQTYALT